MSVKRLLSWQDFDEAVRVIAERFRHATVTGIFGVPRGGLPLAVALSHAMDKRLLMRPDSLMLCVDDIADKGTTIRVQSHWYPDANFVVWVRRSNCPVVVDHVIEQPGDAWLVFPWERLEAADQDEAGYRAREAS